MRTNGLLLTESQIKRILVVSLPAQPVYTGDFANGAPLSGFDQIARLWRTNCCRGNAERTKVLSSSAKRSTSARKVRPCFLPTKLI